MLESFIRWRVGRKGWVRSPWAVGVSRPYPRPTHTRASAPEEEREALRISNDMVAFLRASQNRTTADDPVYVRATPTEAPPENQRCFRCGYLTADATNCPTCAARERGEDDPVFAPTDEQQYPWREPGVSLTNAPTEEQER